LKKFLFFAAIFLVFFSIVFSNDAENQVISFRDPRAIFSHPTERDNFIRYMAVMYNKGYNLSFETAKSISEGSGYTYDDFVLAYYKYFIGELNLVQVKDLKTYVNVGTVTSASTPTTAPKPTETKPVEKQPEVLNYRDDVKEYVSRIFESFIDARSNCKSSGMLDYFDELVPVDNTYYRELYKLKYNPVLKDDYPERTDLVFRMNKLMDYYFELSASSFKSWFAYIFPGKKFSEQDINAYSKYLVDVAYAYSNSFLTFYSPVVPMESFFKQKVIIYDIPAELILAFLVAESRLVPFSFRVEQKGNYAYAVSMGLSHILIDADLLEIDYPEFGNKKVDRYTFDFISSYYLGNSFGKEDIFSDMDLLTVRGSTLYCSIMLELIYQRLYDYYYSVYFLGQ
jgi:hypothetical protein